jgi:hypothetical protein
MASLLRMLGLAYGAAALRQRIRRMAVKAILAVLGGLLAFAALTFFLVALHIWLSGLWGPIESAAAIGAGLLFVALVLFFIVSRRERRTDGPAEQLTKLVEEARRRLNAMSGPDQPLLRNPIVQGILLAVFVGFIVGRRSTRRRED